MRKLLMRIRSLLNCKVSSMHLGQCIPPLRVFRRRQATRAQPQFASNRKTAEKGGEAVTGRPIGPVKLQPRSDEWCMEGLSGGGSLIKKKRSQKARSQPEEKNIQVLILKIKH